MFQKRSKVNRLNLIFAFSFWLLLQSNLIKAQTFETTLSLLSYTSQPPEKLLASRTAVVYHDVFTEQELKEIQKWFQQTGIDALAYFDSEYVFAGKDFIKSYSDYISSRAITFICLIEKANGSITFAFAKASGKNGLIDSQQPAWKVEGNELVPLLRNIYQTALSSQKKQNFLVNDFPEREVAVRNFSGRRSESFSYEVKIAKVAVPRMSVDADNRLLEEMIRQKLPVKVEFVDPSLEESELKQKGFVSILRYVHTRGGFAKELLGYDLSQISNAINSVTYVNGQQQVKTLSSHEIIYKFYFKNLDTGYAYLGTQWDADTSWQTALNSHIEGLRNALKIF